MPGLRLLPLRLSSLHAPICAHSPRRPMDEGKEDLGIWELSERLTLLHQGTRTHFTFTLPSNLCGSAQVLLKIHVMFTTVRR